MSVGLLPEVDRDGRPLVSDVVLPSSRPPVPLFREGNRPWGLSSRLFRVGPFFPPHEYTTLTASSTLLKLRDFPGEGRWVYFDEERTKGTPIVSVTRTLRVVNSKETVGSGLLTDVILEVNFVLSNFRKKKKIT